MSAIYKLSIQGVRSFDPNDRETIEFGKPLTLIVGTNGSGKTTIIECLKYATTGDLPPNSKNGAFIHDPKITGEKDIRAQVKLAFTNAKGVNMIVTRNIQLLAKKNGNTFKTLEGQLVAINHGERTTLSTRANELDQQIPLYLGVPKAILDYVIFCHQEDSLWPLSEPSVLKRRFDEIFQAMKFTKALDNLKTIKKDMSIDIKFLKQSVEHLKTDKDRSNAVKLNIAQLEGKVKEYQTEVKMIEERLHEITEESDKLFSSNQQFQEILSRFDGLNHSKSSLTEQIARLQSSVTLLPNSKEELTYMIQNFESFLNEKNIELKQLKAERDKLVSCLEESRANQRSIATTQGELNAKKSHYALSKDKRERILKELADMYEIPMQEVTTKVPEMLEKANRNLDSLMNQHQKEESKTEEQLSIAKNSLAKKDQQLTYICTDAAKLNEKILRLKSRVETIHVTEDEVKREKETLEHFEAKMKEWNAEKVVDTITNQIKSKNQDILRLEDELENIQQKISKGNQHSSLFAKFALLKSSASTKEKEIEEIKNKILYDAESISLNLNATGDVIEEFKRSTADAQKHFKEVKEQNDETTKVTIKYEQEVASVQSALDQIDSSLQTIENRLKSSLPEDVDLESYDEELRDSEESYKISLENLKMHKTTLEFNLKALEVAKNEKCCYLCQRGFTDTGSANKLIEDLKARTNKNFQIALETTAKEMESYLSDLKGCYNDVLSYRNLKNERNSLQNKLTEMREVYQRKLLMQQEIKEKFITAENELKILNDRIQPHINRLSSAKIDVLKLKTELSSVQEELSIYTSDDTFETIDELQTTQRNINDQLRNFRKEITDLQTQKDDKSREYNNILNLIREKNSRINSMESDLLERNNILKELNENELMLKSSEEESNILSSEVKSLELEISSLTSKFNEMKSLHREEQSAAQSRMEKISAEVSAVNELEDSIKHFEEVDAPQFTKFEKEVAVLSDSIKRDEKRLESIEFTISEQLQKIRDSDSEFNNIKLNMDLHDLKSELQNTLSQIQSLNVTHAEQERKKYQEESLRLRMSYEKFSAENAGKLGEIKQLENQISTLTNQLQTDYKNVEAKYQREWIKLQTKLVVTDDIETYSSALDSAIMKYHGLKMRDINRILDELWKRTYSGTDVETIKIKTDEVSNVRGKSYNYRVVMYKQDAELDMRGRCSAGQKVLAAIIIRLALSETFGVNCGVIALDEPTTNLDEENIESLARSLANIIEVRRHQKNFQLIVITHDEKFLSHMNAASYADHFYKVKRDDRQKSQIEWVDIRKVNA